MRKGGNWGIAVLFFDDAGSSVPSVRFLPDIVFISFASPKETNQRKGGLREKNGVKFGGNQARHRWRQSRHLPKRLYKRPLFCRGRAPLQLRSNWAKYRLLFSRAGARAGAAFRCD